MPTTFLRSLFGALGLVFALGLAGCGGEAPSDGGLSISFLRPEILESTATIAIYFYDGDLTTCAGVRGELPRPPSILGPYMATLDDNQRTRGLTFTLQEVPAGVYTVFIDAVDGRGTIIGSGCAPSQTVFDRQISRIRVTVS